MALGDQAGLAAVQAAVAQIPGLEAFLGDKVNDLHAALAQTLTDGISQAGSVIQADLAPVVEQLAAFNANVAALIGLIQSIKDDGIPVSGMLFGGKKT